MSKTNDNKEIFDLGQAEKMSKKVKRQTTSKSTRVAKDVKRDHNHRFEKIKNLAKSTQNLLYPSNITCDICGAELIADTRYNLCAECISGMSFVFGHHCLNCGVIISSEADYCLRCKREQFLFDKNRSPVLYDGNAKKIVLGLKFGKKKYLANIMATMMVDAYIGDNMSAEIIVPVPMSKEERKRRGFNQAELIANIIGEKLNLPVLPALLKTKNTSEQKQLTRQERAENLKGAFECNVSEVKGRKILLVDDVLTTGQTADSCTKTLLRARAKSVDVLTFAVTKPKMVLETGHEQSF